MENSEQIHQPLHEMFFLQEENCTSGETEGETFFTRGRTLELINLYKKYKPKVGTGQIKNMKKLWEIIAQDLSNLFKITISANKCENRWKVLERNYKKVMDNNNRTGSGLKMFEFQTEFDDIYSKKKNITPTILLSSNNVINNCKTSSELIEQPVKTTNTQENVTINLDPHLFTENVENEVQITLQETPKVNSQKRKRSIKSVSQTYKKRNEILVEMKNDLKAHYEEKNKLEREKLELNKKKFEDRRQRTLLLESYINICNVQKET